MRKLGNVNAFVPMVGTINGKRFSFDGTTLDLTRKAIDVGGEAGDLIQSELGRHRLECNPHESRIPEKLWADKVFQQ
ncbi:hypothetical protein [Paraburkholderia sp. GAS32]|uniref:hypothetical protein n=1 Tax=Paraburkholderia sp. GAS32 TaxID=3035129 RepID=UPI003D25F22E